MLLLIDNYDSFTFNLYQMLGEIYKDIKVVRNDAVTIEDIEKMSLKGIIISPGPGRPEDAGICVELIQKLKGKLPIMGICLGHQAIGYAFGAGVIRAEEIKHGKTSKITNDGKALFNGLDKEIEVMRYHSLVIDKHTLPEELEITAETKDGVIMGVRHKEYSIHGLQFHPESILTEHGDKLLKNFVEVVCGDK